MPKFRVLVEVKEIATTCYQYTVEAADPLDAARMAQVRIGEEGPGGSEPDSRETDVEYTTWRASDDGQEIALDSMQIHTEGEVCDTAEAAP